MIVEEMKKLTPDELTWEVDDVGACAEYNNLLLRAYHGGGWGLARIKYPTILAHSQEGTSPGVRDLESAKREVCAEAENCKECILARMGMPGATA